jgi:hypothetical protein
MADPHSAVAQATITCNGERYTNLLRIDFKSTSHLLITTYESIEEIPFPIVKKKGVAIVPIFSGITI